MGVPFPMTLFSSAFTPLSLFAASEPGGWYDPSDLTTLFQDAAGTTPVTAVEQPVGLVLDKSKGLVLGSELVSNGTFDSDTSWTKGTGWTISGGVASSDGSQTSSSNLSQAAGLVDGKLYKVTFTVLGRSAGQVRPVVGGGGAGSYVSANGTYSQYVVCVAGPIFYLQADADFVGAIDNISVRELPGNHLSQSTSTARPVLSARVNLLTYTEQFDNAYWTEVGVAAITAGSTVAPDGTSTAERLLASAGAGVHCVYSNAGVSVVNGVTYKTSFRVKKDTHRYAYITHGRSAGNYATAVFDLDGVASSATETFVGPTSGAIISTNIQSLGNGWYQLTIDASATGALLYGTLGFAGSATGNAVDTAGNVTFTATGTESIYIWGADLRPANAGVGLPAYQRVGAAVTGTSGTASPPVSPVTGVPDYDTTGFPLYLKFDGTDDSLSSAAIDFSATDSMTLFAGVRKIADTTPAVVIAELSDATTNRRYTFGGFLSDTPNGYYFNTSGGTALSGNPVTSSAYAAPITNVVTTVGDISTDTNKIRLNGTEVSSSSTDQGTGNYNNAPLYVGARTNSIFWFRGHLYSLIVRGAATDAATITATETWVNQRTKAF